MADSKKPRAPAGLGAAGKALWGRLNDKYEFDPREQAVLDVACRQLDMVGELERALAEDGVVVAGSKGQQRINGIVAEVRQGRLAFARLLGDLQLPSGEQERVATWKSLQAKRAVDSRWNRKRARDERHEQMIVRDLADGDDKTA